MTIFPSFPVIPLFQLGVSFLHFVVSVWSNGTLYLEDCSFFWYPTVLDMMCSFRRLSSWWYHWSQDYPIGRRTRRSFGSILRPFALVMRFLLLGVILHYIFATFQLLEARNNYVLAPRYGITLGRTCNLIVGIVVFLARKLVTRSFGISCFCIYWFVKLMLYLVYAGSHKPP